MTTWPVLCSNQRRLRGSVTTPSWTIKLADRSSGSTSPRNPAYRGRQLASHGQATGRESRSFELLNQRSRLAQQGLHRLAFLNGFARTLPVPQRIFITDWSTRSRRTAMHATAVSPAHRRRHTGLARSRFGPAAWAGKHRAGITRMVRRHPFRLRRSGIGARCGSLTISIAVCRASVRAGVAFGVFSGRTSRGA